MALNGRRMQTFFNEFLVTTTSFLNQFANDCEAKFLEFDRKLYKIESNLSIVEQKLASVPNIEEKHSDVLPDVESLKVSEKPTENPVEKAVTTEPIKAATISAPPIPAPPEEVVQQQEHHPVDSNLIRIADSATYKKYFKMLKFGIALPAVKQKMMSEGFDSDLLDNPDLMIEKTPEDDEE